MMRLDKGGPSMRLWADFNDIRHGVVEADLDDAVYFLDDGVTIGSMAELFDGEGHECRGFVVGIDHDYRCVDVQVDWPTWQALHSDRVFTFAAVRKPWLGFELRGPVVGSGRTT